MEPLAKTDDRFGSVVWEVRDALQLDREIEYFDTHVYGGDRAADCSLRNGKGRIQFYDEHYEGDWCDQMRSIIHEHVHFIMWEYMMFTSDVVEASRVACARRAVWSEYADGHLEAVVADMTDVLYGLLESRLEEIGESE